VCRGADVSGRELRPLAFDLPDQADRSVRSLVCDAGLRVISEVSRRLSRLRREGVRCHQRLEFR
jgi:hypothetical protein